MAELSTIARPYAKAVFQYARENAALAEWERMLAVAAAVAEDPRMSQWLSQPQIDNTAKAAAFAEVCGDVLDESARNLLVQLAENKRLGLLPAIFALFHELYAEQQQVLDAEFTSAHDLQEAEIQKLVEVLKKRFGREVRATTSVDPTLIGGVLVRVGDTVIDGTVRGRLGRLAEQLNS